MDETIARALYGWEIAKEKIAGHNYDLIILDEFTYAMHFGWLDANQVVDWLKANKPEDLHLVITGRDAPEALIEYADLVTEMRESNIRTPHRGFRHSLGSSSKDATKRSHRKHPAARRSCHAIRRLRQDRLTKPLRQPGTPGRAIHSTGGMRADPFPSVERKAVIVMAADHGVALDGRQCLSAGSDTANGVELPERGRSDQCAGAGRGAGRDVDIGVASEFEEMPGLVRRKVRCGTRNLARGPAMTRAEAEGALQAGVDVFG